MKGARGTNVGAPLLLGPLADFVLALPPWPPEALAAAGAFARGSCSLAAGSCPAEPCWSSRWSCPWATADAAGFGPNLVHAREPTPARNSNTFSARSRSFSSERFLRRGSSSTSGVACSAIATPPWQRTKDAQLVALSPLPSPIHCRLAFEVDGFRE